jgi:Excalibur calcium-binding domain
MFESAASRDNRTRQLRSRVQGARAVYQRRTRVGMIRACAAGLVIGVTVFVTALFLLMPQAPPSRILGTDERIIGIPKNCDEARAAQIAPMARGAGFYNPKLDDDKNGLACETSLFR